LGTLRPVPVCRFPARNPSVVQDGRLAFRPIAVRPPSADRNRAREWVRAAIDTRLARWPGLRALSLAVWLGETSTLPDGLALLYRQGGLLHLLALSGQHVAALWLIVAGVLASVAPFAVRFESARRAYFWIGKGAPLLGAAFLVWINPGNEPMARAAAMLAAIGILALRRLRATGLQLACTSVAVLIVLSPERLASDSFLLSAVATVFLCAWMLDGKKVPGWRQYFSLSLVMPVLLLPISAFFFGQVALMAAPNALLVGWVWSVAWVPLGFAAPFLAAFFPLTLLEKGWTFFLETQTQFAPWIAAGYRAVPRPTWLETVAWEVLAVVCVFGGRRWWAQAWRRRVKKRHEMMRHPLILE
jgi:competence protein ComEC